MHISMLDIVAVVLISSNFFVRFVNSDALDYAYCFCGGHWQYRNTVYHQIPPSKPEDPEPKVNYAFFYFNYRSEVHQRNFTSFLPMGPLHETPIYSTWIRTIVRDRINIWDDAELNYTWPGVDDAEPVYFEKIRSAYRFNKGKRKHLPRRHNHRYERITDCTNWCRGVFPNEPDITSICNQSAPGFVWMKRQLLWESNMLKGWTLPPQDWEWPEDQLECKWQHYKALDDDP